MEVVLDTMAKGQGDRTRDTNRNICICDVVLAFFHRPAKNEARPRPPQSVRLADDVVNVVDVLVLDTCLVDGCAGGWRLLQCTVYSVYIRHLCRRLTSNYLRLLLSMSMGWHLHLDLALLAGGGKGVETY
eukprot:scaffold34792_cov157-Isochrysis_galbana.AAC.1